MIPVNNSRTWPYKMPVPSVKSQSKKKHRKDSYQDTRHRKRIVDYICQHAAKIPSGCGLSLRVSSGDFSRANAR